MAVLFAYLFLALGISFLCSILESVILSITPSYIQSLVEQQKSYGLQLQHLKKNIDRPLSAILSINTVAHTLGASGVGAQAVKIFGEVYFGVISAILTLLILIFSEIIPKTVGAEHWKKLAAFTARVLKVMIVIAYPLVLLSEAISKVISKQGTAHSTSREEVTALVKLGYEENIFDEKEAKVIQNVIWLKDILAEKALTPRTVLKAVPEDMSLQEFIDQKDLMSFSRIPVYRENIDQIDGYVLKHDVLESLANDHHERPLKSLKREVPVVYEKTHLLRIFEVLLEKKEHLALVVDEYGGVEGIITMEDIFEVLLGEDIVDELDRSPNMKRLAMQKWRAKSKQLSKLTKNSN